MKILVIGSGGREHAIIKKIKQNKNVSEIYAIPGNGGIERDAICIDIKATDINAIKGFAKKNNIDYAIVTPDDPLVAGLVDALEEIKIPCFGPNKNAAIIEGSKVFAKNLMKKYKIPTAKYETFESYDKAIEYLKTAPMPTVIKADGLALGKGVIIAETKEKAFDTVKNIMKDKAFGKSGDRIVIEEFLEGVEVSILSFTDGKTIIPMISSMDHKRIGDKDTGLNTGGMGTIAPNPYYTKEIAKYRMYDKTRIKKCMIKNERLKENDGKPFTWKIKPKERIETKEGHLKKGTCVQVAACMGFEEEHPETHIAIGIIDEDGEETYIENGVNLVSDLKVKKSGQYRVFLENQGKKKEVAGGYYMVVTEE